MKYRHKSHPLEPKSCLLTILNKNETLGGIPDLNFAILADCDQKVLMVHLLEHHNGAREQRKNKVTIAFDATFRFSVVFNVVVLIFLLFNDSFSRDVQMEEIA